jgi:hypothetical protein
MVELSYVSSAERLGGYLLRLTFDDGTVGDVDLGYLVGRGPVFEPLQDPDFFAQVTVDRELGTIVWPNGADVAPETLYAVAREHRANA